MKDKYKHIFFELIIFGMIYYLGVKTFKDEYLFQWVVHNYKFFFVMISIPIIIILFNQKILSSFVSAGITLGIFIGNFGGEILRNINLNKIVEGMTQEEIYMLRSHKGFYIMMVTIIIFTAFGIIFQIKANKQKFNK